RANQRVVVAKSDHSSAIEVEDEASFAYADYI
ncbi:MAG: hypothetical protein ACJAUZ_001401, partial [Flavobacteriaceae bacterium]